MISKYKNDLLEGGALEVNHPQQGLVLGNRIPRDYFLTRGTGESDITIHAGSYHLALRTAGIEQFNIITYSSILPGITREVPKPENMTHGSVVESIMAVAHGNKGERVTAGIIYGWLKNRVSGERYGGLVCEHNGSCTVPQIRRLLSRSLEELYVNGFEEQYELEDILVETEYFVPGKKFGTALVALCFTNYLYPVIAAKHSSIAS